MRNFFQRLMYGRYGTDTLNNTMLVLCIALMILSRVFRQGWLNILSIAVLVICYLRLFSRNINARYQENQKFLTAVQPVRKWFGGCSGVRGKSTSPVPNAGRSLSKKREKYSMTGSLWMRAGHF